MISPLIRITPIEAEVELAGVGAILFTSANGVEQFARVSRDRSRPAFCVGSMTTTAAREVGFDARSAEGDVEALADLIIARHQPEDGSCLHVRGVHAAGQLVERLETAGIDARSVELYDQAPGVLEEHAAGLLKSGQIDVVTVFSARTATIFHDQVVETGWSLQSVTAVALSAAADAALGELAFKVRRIAPRPGRDGMLDVLAEISA
ncbi:MAG: uroporphyrinogen-III synthase [Pseudomonadota bacterium]